MQHFVAYRKKYKEGLMTNNANILQTAQLMLQDWLKYCDAARVPEYLNQNEMNIYWMPKQTGIEKDIISHINLFNNYELCRICI